MNYSGAWIIHGLRVRQMQGMEGEAVVYHRETLHNAADAVRSARPKGKNCRLKINKFLCLAVQIGNSYE
jgi:hypothetical protein